MPWHRERRVVAATAHGGRLLGEALPQRGGGVQQQQMDLTSGRERVQNLEVGGRQPGETEQAQPAREIDELRLATQARAGGLDSLGGMRDVRQPLPQMPPEACLPDEIVGQRAAVLVDQVARGPGGDHPRAVAGVAVEQGGQSPGDAETATAGLGGAVEVPLQRGEPRLAGVCVDDLGQRPGRVCRMPRVFERVDARRARHGVGDDRARGREPDVGADAGALSELLCHPSLDSARRDRHHVGGEWIFVTDVPGQLVDEPVCAFGAVNDQHTAALCRAVGTDACLRP